MHSPVLVSLSDCLRLAGRLFGFVHFCAVGGGSLVGMIFQTIRSLLSLPLLLYCSEEEEFVFI